MLEQFYEKDTDTIAASGNVAVATNKFMVTAANGTITTTGGDLIINHSFLPIKLFHVHAANGNAELAGALEVTGLTTLTKTIVNGSFHDENAGGSSAANDVFRVHSADGEVFMKGLLELVGGFRYGSAGISGLSAMPIGELGDNTETNLTFAHSVMSKKFVTTAMNNKVINLPNIVVGMSFIIVNTGVSADQSDTAGTEDQIHFGHKLDIKPASGDKFLVKMESDMTNGEDLAQVPDDSVWYRNTQNTQEIYDFLHLVGHADGGGSGGKGWMVVAMRGKWQDASGDM